MSTWLLDSSLFIGSLAIKHRSTCNVCGFMHLSPKLYTDSRQSLHMAKTVSAYRRKPGCCSESPQWRYNTY